MNLSDSIDQYFRGLADPRIENHNHRHKLHDILVITLLGTICGADTWTDICEFGQAKEDWLKSFLELPNSIPSHDTFGRVFSLLDPEAFEQCFLNWIRSLSIDVTNEIIAIDGKTLRRSGDAKQKKKGLHMVSAWAADNRVLLGQVRTAEKSNEITAVPELLKQLDVKGSIVTLDAMGCQTEIAKNIINKEADYVLALKENQRTLYQNVVSIFKQGAAIQYKKMLNKQKIEKVKNHGRIERRRYTLISARDRSMFAVRWPGLKSIGMVEVKRTVNNETTRSTRYYLTSLDEDIDGFMKAVRQHWQIEINLHWSLDVSFNEDQSRVRIGNATENLAIIRRITLNLLKKNKTRQVGITAKRKRAGWDNQFLMDVLMAFENEQI